MNDPFPYDGKGKDDARVDTLKFEGCAKLVVFVTNY